jgi:predicted Zn finger-like uncharacterized protein
MPTLVHCPKCATNFSVSDERRNQPVRCARCGTHFALASLVGELRPGAEKTPQSIDRYVIKSKLGAGAFGVVYRAHHPVLDRDVALKVLRPMSESAVKRFLREARILAKFDHPNIVKIHDAGQQEKQYYLATGLVEGRTLADILQAGALPPVQAVELVIQILDALEYAHTFPGGAVVHRDVKPANAMVDMTGRVHLMDFGMAGGDDQPGTRLTQMGTTVGTPAYMSPEQAEGRIDRIGPTADQYSAGVVLYEALTGHRPFEVAGPLIFVHIVSSMPPPLTRYRPDLDPELERLCLKALAKQPADRHRSAGTFAALLRDWLGRQHLSPIAVVPRQAMKATDPVMHLPTPEPTPSFVSTAPSPRRSSGMLWLVLVLLLLVLGGGAAAFFFLRTSTPTTSSAPTDNKGYRNRINE